MSKYKYKVVYQWFNKRTGHPMQMTVFMTQADLAKLLVQPDTRLVYVSSNLEQSRTTKSSKPIAK